MGSEDKMGSVTPANARVNNVRVVRDGASDFPGLASLLAAKSHLRVRPVRRVPLVHGRHFFEFFPLGCGLNVSQSYTSKL